MEERLQKILSRGGVASRRAAETLILDGRVSVNGRVVTELGTRADPAIDTIAVDGRPVQRSGKHTYLMLNKPRDFVTTRQDPEGRQTVYELVPDIPGLFTVGRLDRETEGLLLMTTDGEWAERIAHPRYQVEREYEVRVAGPVSPDALAALRDGIMLDGKAAQPVAAYQSGHNGLSAILTIVILEGRKREVRMLCSAAGITVKRLVRRRIGPLLLGWLLLGHWRNLDVQEVKSLAEGHRRSRVLPASRKLSAQAHSNVEEGETETGDTESLHRDRRPGGVRQVNDRQGPGVGGGVPLSRHRRDVSRRDEPVPGAWDRPRGRDGRDGHRP
jgi:23S rRNA pseudouridine2605 synthase